MSCDWLRSCRSKKPYKWKQEAQKVIAQRQEQKLPNSQYLNVYSCIHCGYWHIGHHYTYDKNREDHNAMRTQKCRSCGAEIIWLKTDKGKSMPIDAHSVELGDEQFEHGRHTSHFSSCPNANQHRRG